MEKYNQHIHSHLPSAYFPPCWKARPSCFTGFFVDLGAKTFYLTYTTVRPQAGVYQEMRSAINKYRKTTLTVVRTAATLMNA